MSQTITDLPGSAAPPGLPPAPPAFPPALPPYPPFVSPVPSPSSRRWQKIILVISLLMALLSLSTLAKNPFYDPDEFNYITAARNMVEGGNWVTPYFNGQPRLVKPVMFYWIVAVAYKLFGTQIAVARFCSAFSAIVAVTGIYFIARHLLGKRSALLATVIAAGHLTVVQITHFATTDTTLWAFTTWCNYAFVRLAFPTQGEATAAEIPSSETSPPPASLGAKLTGFSALFFVALACALLTKGPIAFVWCLVPLIWLIIKRDWKAFTRWRWGWGIVILLAIIGPWSALFVLRNYHRLHDLLIDPSSHESYAQFGGPISRLGQILQIFPQLLPNILPWLPLIVMALAHARKVKFTARMRCGGFLIFWLCALLFILSLAQRKSFRYMFPPICATSLLLAGWLETAFDDPRLKKPMRDAAIAYGIAMLVIGLPIIGLILFTKNLQTNWLWAHVAVQFVAAAIFLFGCRRTTIQQSMAGIMTASLYLNAGLLNLTVWPLLGNRIATLAPEIQHVLSADQPLILFGGLTPRYLVFMARRNVIDIRDMNDLLPILDSFAEVLLIRQRDWDKVPAQYHAMFYQDDTCQVLREPLKQSLNISDNLEPALLMVRRKESPTRPTTLPAALRAAMPQGAP